MKKRDYRDYVRDIIDSLNDIEAFVDNASYSDFLKDKKTINAVVRSIEIMGEAVKKLPLALKNKYHSIPWKKIAGMRDKLIHEYFGVDLEILWTAAKRDVPLLREKMLELSKEAGG
ncbi:DUF86 domain-containing protein [bacterium]|nr:MAG: DUF86 domain-containing protein [bacterium]